MFGTKVAKVAALQLATVLLQAFGKLRLLGGIVIFGMERQAAVQSLQLAFWCFFGLLLWNGLYPSLLFIFPNSTWCRYNSAMMDVILDLGYVLTYLVMVVLGMSELSLKASATGNFGDLEELKFSNSTSPNLWNFWSFNVTFCFWYVSMFFMCFGILFSKTQTHMVKLTISPSIHRYQPRICISIGHASVPGRVRECGTRLLCLQSSRKDSSRICEDRVQGPARPLI